MGRLFGVFAVQTILLSVLIWQACDPFADAAQWVGQRFGIPGSVRGATLDAVASSMPEFFSGCCLWLLLCSY
jgi:cation:H+ antiporter